MPDLVVFDGLQQLSGVLVGGGEVGHSHSIVRLNLEAVHGMGETLGE